jgi:hypothetical protein
MKGEGRKSYHNLTKVKLILRSASYDPMRMVSSGAETYYFKFLIRCKCPLYPMVGHASDLLSLASYPD